MEQITGFGSVHTQPVRAAVAQNLNDYSNVSVKILEQPASHIRFR
jgi:hypothetical protein